MILYDKDAKFLGVSADILSVLGYEDINAFMTYNNDVADLFVNRQGYVHKFDNFSWISYVLNGSLSNKNVIIKTRNSNEIEASISITELFLHEKDDKCYLVSLNNIRQIFNDTSKNDDLNNKQPIFKIDGGNEAKESIFAEQQTHIDSVVTTDDSDNKISFIFNKEDLKPTVSATSETLLNTENLKNTATAENTAATAVRQTQTINQNTNTFEIKIDTQEISDLLGIDKLDIIEYLKEYVAYLDANLSQLQELYKNGNISQAKRIAINLIGIGSNLRSKELVQTLQKLLSVGSNVNNLSILQEIETVVFAFKQSVSKL
ncbi:MAG: hypothetical protein LBI78_03530 [Campylobacteraceae bacterium]|nr:hypothetical protein [Campylobacteraceae bacterium]